MFCAAVNQKQNVGPGVSCKYIKQYSYNEGKGGKATRRAKGGGSGIAAGHGSFFLVEIQSCRFSRGLQCGDGECQKRDSLCGCSANCEVECDSLANALDKP